MLQTLLLSLWLVSPQPQSPQDYVDRAVAAFEKGDGIAALAHFDALMTLIPDVKPELWQRGIVLYDLGRYKECAEQFSAFHELSQGDGENAAWEFFCVSKAQSPAAARAGLFKVDDPRVMRMEIYGMLMGQYTPDQIVEFAGTLPIALFYTHLYAGFYLESQGDTKGAIAHLTEAADLKYAEYGGFMNIAGRVHLATLTKAAHPTP